MASSLSNGLVLEGKQPSGALEAQAPAWDGAPVSLGSLAFGHQESGTVWHKPGIDCQKRFDLGT
jgi:hypothetical protein